MHQLAFDFPFPVLPIREFLDLKFSVERAERDWRYDLTVEKPEWLLRLREQFKEMCAARGHQRGRPWDNGIGCVFIDCARCGTRIETQHYKTQYDDEGEE